MDSAISSALPTSSGADNLSLRIDLLVRLWASAHRDAGAAQGENQLHQTELLALIEDVAASRKATVLKSSDLIYISGFSHIGNALAAARQIELAAQGFRRRNPSVPVAVSIGIDAQQHAAANMPGADFDPPRELVSLLRMSRPAQILLTHDLYQQISGYVGIPLKPFPLRFGVHEYLWMDEDQLEVLKSEPHLTLAVITKEEPASGQTPSQTVSPVVEPAITPQPFGEPMPSRHLGRSTQLSEVALTSRWDSLLRSPRVWLMAGVPLLVIAVIVGVIVSRSPSHPPAASPSGSSSGAAEPASSGTPASSHSGVPSPTNPAPIPPATTAANSTTSVHKPPSATPKKHLSQKEANPPASTPAPESTPPAAERTAPPSERPASCSQADVASLLRFAKVNRANGNLDDATRQLKGVLQCEPNNVDALNELARIRAHPE